MTTDLTPFEKIKPHLQNLQDHGDYWTALCPAHDDSRNSLSVRETSDGTLLLKCHADCSTPEIVYSVGLTMSELFPKPARAKVKRSHIYRNASGEITHRKDIKTNGEGAWWHKTEDSWESGYGSKKATLYRADELAKNSGSAIWLTEGEKDSDTLASLGLNSTSLPSTGKWLKAYNKTFQGRDVILCEDNDKAGRAHIEKCGKALQGIAKSIRVVRFEEMLEKSDVTDFLEAGGTVDQLLQRAEQWSQESPGPEQGEIFTLMDATDRANAELFIELHGENIRYCFQWKSWLIWDGQRWKRDETGQIVKRSYSVSDKLFQRAHEIEDDSEHKKCLEHAQRAANKKGIESFLKLAQCLVPVTVNELNQNAWLLNCPNGTVDLKTGSIRSHARQDFLTVMCPVEFDSNSPSMVWDSFLESTFANHGDVIPFLQRLFGSALVGIVRDHILPVFWGSGANGKSTLLNSILDTLGNDYAMQANPEMLMDSDLDRHPTERADLYGKRFVAAVETEANKRLKESFVKGLTGGDKIRARFLYKDFFEFDPSHTIVLCSNHKPKVYGDDYGIWRRLRLVPFVETFKGSQADDRLSEKLKNEASGILAWMVQGCLDWQAQGLNEPETVLKATEEYKSESDVVGHFIESECLLGDHYNTKFADFYSEFEEWTEQNGENLPSKTKVGRILNERFYQMPDRRGRWYRGIGLRNK